MINLLPGKTTIYGKGVPTGLLKLYSQETHCKHRILGYISVFQVIEHNMGGK